MKVKALILFNDLKAKKLRKAGEIFEVSTERAGELNTGPHGVLVEAIDKGGEKDVGKDKTGPKNKKRSV